MLYDLSPQIDASLPVWPGDTPMSREVLADMRRGDNITLSTLRATVHLGAHADAPSHYGRDARSIESMSLEYYIGPCRVVRVSAAPSSRVSVAEVEAALKRSAGIGGNAAGGLGIKAGAGIGATRILIDTGTRPDPHIWNNDFAALSPELVDWLHGLGVITVGTDAPSVDVIDSKDLPAHQAFLQHDMAILEGLLLRDVPEGIYELIAPPLKLAGFDASPVRAVLRSLD